MYVTKSSSKVKDVASLFDPSDFYNSAVVYNLPRCSDVIYTMSYLTREDLVSTNVYGLPSQMGLILLSHGQTCHMEGGSLVRDDLPLSDISVKRYTELESLISVSVNSNSLTTKDISKTSSKAQEVQYAYNGGRFEVTD